MTIDELWKTLASYGAPVPRDVQDRVGRDFNQERVQIRPPGTAAAKTRVLEFGTGVPATFVARQLGITVQRVYQIRRLLK